MSIVHKKPLYADAIAKIAARCLAVLQLPLDPSEAQLAQIATAVGELSLGFTRERELVGARYLEDERLLSAYLLFYFLTSYAQARQIFGEVTGSLGRVLDIGAGPGPMSVAAIDAGAESVVAIDHSPRALALLTKLAAGAPITTQSIKLPQLPFSPQSFDTIVMGHVLNELQDAATVAERALSLLKPGGRLIIIEPALRETSRTLLQLRDRLVQHRYAILAPCFFRGNCPALVREQDWCHAERAFAAPPIVDLLAARAKIHKDTIKMSYLIVGASDTRWPVAELPQLYRIVSSPLEAKGQQRYVGCGPAGRTPIGRLDRHVNAMNEDFDTLERGDVIVALPLVDKGDGKRIMETTAVRRVRHAGEAPPTTQEIEAQS